MKKEGGIYKKSFYCCDLPGCVDGDGIFDLFLLSKMDYCSNDRAVKWFNVILADCSGYTKAKIWSDKMLMEYEGYVGHVVLVQGRISFYGGRPELSVEKMKLMEEGSYHLSEICRSLSKQKLEAYMKKIAELTEKIDSQELKTFLKDMLCSEVLQQMGRLPVHLKGHHSYRGALLEHTCEVAFTSYCIACSARAVHSTRCNVDFVIAGALLHDIASLIQYKEEGYGFVSKDVGRLIGRTGMAQALLDERKEAAHLDEKLYNLLIHIIHSSHENGMEPMIMEAMIVKNANRLSAELELYESTCMSNKMIYAQDDTFIWSKDLKRAVYVRKDISYGKES